MVNTKHTRVRTHSHNTYVQKPHLESRVMKASDVVKPLPQKRVDNRFNSVCKAPISMHNRFNILSHIDTSDTDQSHVLKTSIGKQNVQSVCQNSGTDTSEHTKGKVNKPLGEFKENKHINDDTNRGVKPKNHTGNDLNGTNHKRDVILIETEDKYDLELRFRPKHR